MWIKRLLLMAFMAAAGYVPAKGVYHDYFEEKQYFSYMDDLRILNPGAMRNLMQNTIALNKTLVIMVYPSKNCIMCRMMVKEFNRLAQTYPADETYLLVVAIDEDAQAVSNFLGTIKEGIYFTPLMVQPQDYNQMINVMRYFRSNIEPDKLPYLGVLDGKGFITNVPPTPFYPGKLVSAVERALTD